MALNPAVKRMLRAMSGDEVEVEASRNFANLKSIDPLRKFKKSVDYIVDADGRDIPTRVYFPDDFVVSGAELTGRGIPVLLFVHGGGWISDSVDNYDLICMRLTNRTDTVVVSVEYRLAPEHRFPSGLEDCYTVAKRLIDNNYFLHFDPERITLIGDSAGGNLVAALSLLLRDRGDLVPRKQILIYPATDCDHSEKSKYPSVIENGKDFLLTSQKIENFMELYASSESDYDNPYFAPMNAADCTNQPDTLIITAQYDPLRDEGEAYGRKLSDSGNTVELHRIDDALHGFFALGLSFSAVTETLDYIGEFLVR